MHVLFSLAEAITTGDKRCSQIIHHPRPRTLIPNGIGSDAPSASGSAFEFWHLIAMYYHE